MPEVTVNIRMWAVAAAASPHLCNNPPCPPCPTITDTRQQNCRGGNGVISLKNSESDRTKRVDRRGGCGGEGDGGGPGIAVIFFL